MKNKIIIFTGGTGGHVIPAVNFANYLIFKGYNCSIITDIRGKKYIKDFYGKIYLIKSSHFSGSIFKKLISSVNFIIGFFQSIILLLKERPNKCLSFGSYATFMPLFSTIILKFIFKIDIYLHEQNSVIGKVNIVFLPYVEKLFTNFNFIKNLNKKYLNKKIDVGLPFNYKLKSTIVKNKILNEKKIIFVYGGSQGSIPLIKNILLILKNINVSHLKNIKFIIQSPKIYQNQLIKILLKLNIKFEINEFFNEIEKILLISDLAITRAGAGTINDLIKYKVPSIIIPLPNSVNNHQFYNASYLSNKNAAILVDEKNFNVDKNTDIFMKLIQNNKILKNMINELNKINLNDSNNIILSNIFYEN